MRKLSDRQQRMLQFLRSFVQENGYPPSIRDICKACGISSTSVVDYNLNILQREGYIRRDPDISRGIEITDTERVAANVVRIPLLGLIAAGEPIPVPSPDSWSTNVWDEEFELTEEITGGKADLYALRVKGTSMIDALINDNDIVLMQPAQTAENGEMVAAWLKAEKETTLKKFYQEDDLIRLQPANSQMNPIYVKPENIEIQGKVVGVIRQLQ